MSEVAEWILSRLAERSGSSTWPDLRRLFIRATWPDDPIPDPDAARELWKQYLAGGTLLPVLKDLCAAGRVETVRASRRMRYRLKEEA